MTIVNQNRRGHRKRHKSTRFVAADSRSPHEADDVAGVPRPRPLGFELTESHALEFLLIRLDLFGTRQGPFRLTVIPDVEEVVESVEDRAATRKAWIDRLLETFDIDRPIGAKDAAEAWGIPFLMAKIRVQILRNIGQWPYPAARNPPVVSRRSMTP